MLNDLRYAIRMLLKSPGFTSVAVLTLALGIGANTAIFSIVNGVLLRPLPYPDSNRLVRVFESVPDQGKDKVPVSGPTFKDWRAQNTVFNELAAQQLGLFNLTGRGEPRRLRGERVSASLLAVLGVKPFLGRSFTSSEETYGSQHVVLLSHSLWQREFGTDTNAVGKSIALDGISHEIVGVLPLGLNYPDEATELWVPLVFAPDDTSRQSRVLQIVGRLKQGVAISKATTEMNTIAARLSEEYPETKGSGVTLEGLQDELVGGSRNGLLLLLGAVGFVLLIACTNVANLLLARAALRSKEFAVRAALGAGRLRIMRQLFTESLMLTGVGGAFGIVLAGWILSATASFGTLDVPRLHDVKLDTSVLVFSLALTIGTALIFGLVNLLHASRSDVNQILKEGGQGSASPPRRDFVRNLLIVSQTALSLVLLVGAGLLIRSLDRVNQVDPGFNPSGVLTARLSLSEARYPSEAKAAAFIQRLVERVDQLPGVSSAGAIFGLPLEGMDPATSAYFDDRPAPPTNGQSYAGYHQMTPGYFKTMGTALLKGRDFDTHDTADGQQVVIINEAFVREFCQPAEEVLGRRLKIGAGPGTPVEIVGVVQNVRHNSLTQKPRPELYVPFSQQCWGDAALVVGTRTKPATLAPALREAVSELDPELPLDHMQPMTALMSGTIGQRRFQTLILSFFAGAALALAVLGIYGVTAFSVSRRTHEIGIRMALGARGADVLRLIAARGMKPVMIGIGIGVVLSLFLARMIRGLLFGIGPTDPVTFLTVATLFSFVAVAACYLPARRASQVDPMEALRNE